MEKYLISEQKLIDIADAIREKTETSEPIVVSQMDEAIRAIQVGVDTSDATAAAEDILSGKTAYVKEEKVTGTMANNGAVSATLGFGDVYTVPNGFHSGSGTVTAPSLPVLTNPASAENIDSGKQAIDGSGNLINGTSTKVDTSDATATAADISTGKTAYVNNLKITGTGKIMIPVTLVLKRSIKTGFESKDHNYGQMSFSLIENDYAPYIIDYTPIYYSDVIILPSAGFIFAPIQLGSNNYYVVYGISLNSDLFFHAGTYDAFLIRN